jgi:hypothetical protein
MGFDGVVWYTNDGLRQERIGWASFETRNGVEANRRETDVMMMDAGLDRKRGTAQHNTARHDV